MNHHIVVKEPSKISILPLGTIPKKNWCYFLVLQWILFVQKEVIFCSGDDFEAKISQMYRDVFNSNPKDDDETPYESRDSRSDDQVKTETSEHWYDLILSKVCYETMLYHNNLTSQFGPRK